MLSGKRDQKFSPVFSANQRQTVDQQFGVYLGRIFTFLNQTCAVAVEEKQAGAQKHQNEQIDRKDPRRER